MPCRDGGPDPSTEMEYKKSTIRNMRKKVDTLTQNLCFLCGTLEGKRMLKSTVNPRIMEWWEKHKVTDERRVMGVLRTKLSSKLMTAAEAAEKCIEEAEKVHPVSDWHRKWFHNLAIQVAKELSDERASEASSSAERANALAKLTKKERKLLGLK